MNRLSENFLTTFNDAKIHCKNTLFMQLPKMWAALELKVVECFDGTFVRCLIEQDVLVDPDAVPGDDLPWRELPQMEFIIRKERNN